MPKILGWSEENISATALRDLRYQPAAGFDVPDRLLCQNSRGLGNGTMNLTLFTPTRTLTVSSITVSCLTGGAISGGTTVRKMGLFTVSGLNLTCVARTANDTASDGLCTASNTLYNRVFTSEAGYSSSYTLLAGTTYACGILLYNTGGTFNTPSVSGFQNASPLLSGTLTPSIVLSAASQTDITNTTVTAGTGAGGSAWFRLT